MILSADSCWKYPDPQELCNLLCDVEVVVFLPLFRDGEVEEAEKVYFVYVSGFVKAIFKLVSDRFTSI